MRPSPPRPAPYPPAHADPPARQEPDWFGPDFDRAGRGRRTAILVSVPIVVILAVGTAAALTWALWPTQATLAAPPPPAAPDSPQDTPSGPARHHTPGRTAAPVPSKGTGTYTLATGGTGRVGHGGTLIRYTVRVEGGLHQDTAAFARSVDAILAAPHGWTTAGRWSFQRVSSGPHDFVITLASPVTSTRLCAAGGMQTGGTVNCSAPGDVVINLKRWIQLTPYYQGRPDLYHALAVNHEVGHRLGFGHMACPGKGSPAPVMMQQIFGLHGCVINGWPYTAGGRLITGPSVP